MYRATVEMVGELYRAEADRMPMEVWEDGWWLVLAAHIGSCTVAPLRLTRGKKPVVVKVAALWWETFRGGARSEQGGGGGPGGG